MVDLVWIRSLLSGRLLFADKSSVDLLNVRIDGGLCKKIIMYLIYNVVSGVCGLDVGGAPRVSPGGGEK